MGDTTFTKRGAILTMSILLSASRLKKTYASRTLFDGVSFSLKSEDRVGLIGPNGAGKSTLLKILAGLDDADEGELTRQRGLRVSLVDQVPQFRDESIVLTAVLEGTRDLPLSEREDLSAYDGMDIARAAEVISQLGLEAFSEMKMNSLSGGWRKRVALARALASQPDLLLMDEPTNHLDVESIRWLENFLSHANFATLTITHDRLFLQRISKQIWDLDRANPDGLLIVQGSYLEYLTIKEGLIQGQLSREVSLKNSLRRETQWLRQGAKARTTKQQARIQRAGELAKEVEELGERNYSRNVGIDFSKSNQGPSPKRLLESKGLSKKMGSETLFKDVDLFVGPRSRIALIGQNGCGKSTFIRTLLGTEEPDSGTVQRGDSLRVSFFEQNRESLDPKKTVAQTLCEKGDYVQWRGQFVHIFSYLDRFLFPKEKAQMPVERLSGGEQSRLVLAKLMLQDSQVLVLDEPTNDLDMATLAVLEDSLEEFDGAVLLVTHDRYFLDQVADQILAFSPDNVLQGKLTSFASLAQWERWHEEILANGSRAETSVGRKNSDFDTPQETLKKPQAGKLTYKDQRELEMMESSLEKAESLVSKLTASTEDPKIQSDAKKLESLHKELAQAQFEVDRLYSRWQELTSALEKKDAPR